MTNDRQPKLVATPSASDIPAGRLEGQSLDGGWTVVERLSLRDSTGGNFSVGYIVRREGGPDGFLKALDLSRALEAADVTFALQALTEAFNFEQELLSECSRAGLTRVVRLLDHGTIPGSSVGAHVPVPYLILEKADGNVRQHLARLSTSLDTAFRLRALHQIAVGVGQMHRKGIAHQDVKPSNILVFDTQGAKIGDVGSASRRGVASPRDGLRWAGDRGYTPPEVLYGAPGGDWETRRRACDLYQLGSMATFFVTGMGMTPLMLGNLEPSLGPEVWTGNYEGVLPHLQNAFSRALMVVHDNAPIGLQDQVTELISYQCEPDLAKRGHPRSMPGLGSQYSVERFISAYNRLAISAEIALRAEATR